MPAGRLPPRGRSEARERTQTRGSVADSGPATEVVHGLRAGLAVWERRPEAIVRFAWAREVGQEIAELARWAASRQTPHAQVSVAELDRLAQSSHHEGLCVVTLPRRWVPISDLAAVLVQGNGIAVALDRVRNPYNVGAILRTAAFFGVTAVVLGAPAPHPGLAPIAIRVAEGGAEHLTLARTTDLADTLARLRSRGVRVLGADARASTSAVGFAYSRPAVLVMGNEREGLGERVRKQCDALVAVPPIGGVESLNVAVAAGVMVAEVVRPQIFKRR